MLNFRFLLGLHGLLHSFYFKFLTLGKISDQCSEKGGIYFILHVSFKANGIDLTYICVYLLHMHSSMLKEQSNILRNHQHKD